MFFGENAVMVFIFCFLYKKVFLPHDNCFIFFFLLPRIHRNFVLFFFTKRFCHRRHRGTVLFELMLVLLIVSNYFLRSKNLFRLASKKRLHIFSAKDIATESTESLFLFCFAKLVIKNSAINYVICEIKTIQQFNNSTIQQLSTIFNNFQRSPTPSSVFQT